MIRILLSIFLFTLLHPIHAAENAGDSQMIHSQIEDADKEAAINAPLPAVNPHQKLLDSATATIEALEKERSTFEKLNRQIEAASGDNKVALELQFQQKALRTLELIFELSDILKKQIDKKLDTTELRDTVASYIMFSSNALDIIMDAELDEHVSKRSETVDLAGFGLIEFERLIANDLEWIETLFKKKIRIIRELEHLDINPENHRENLLNRLVPFADNLSSQIQLIVKAEESLSLSIGDSSPSDELRAELLGLKTRETSTVGALSAIVIMLDENEVDSTRYRQLLLQTGEISTDLFNPRIVMGIVEKRFANLMESTRDNAGYIVTQTILFLAILGSFKLIARFTTYLMRRSFDTRRMETSKLMQEMLLSLSNRGIMIFGFLIALSQLGVEITAFLTGIGIAGFIVGFALQDSLANFAAGIMILGYRPFDVDDVIEAGNVVGTVSKMSLVSTTILTFDNQTLIVPNNKIWGDVIKNISLQDNRRIDMEFRVDYSEDIEQVKAMITTIIDAHEKILQEPSPTVEMNELSPYAMIFVVRPWVERGDYWSTKWVLMKAIKEKLDSENVRIPVLNQSVVTTP
jgi:small conductance mechanosensitive channel